jgi:hypothetical protein
MTYDIQHKYYNRISNFLIYNEKITVQLASDFQNININKNADIRYFDISNMYTNIPVQVTIIVQTVLAIQNTSTQHNRRDNGHNKHC